MFVYLSCTDKDNNNNKREVVRETHFERITFAVDQVFRSSLCIVLSPVYMELGEFIKVWQITACYRNIRQVDVDLNCKKQNNNIK